MKCLHDYVVTKELEPVIMERIENLYMEDQCWETVAQNMKEEAIELMNYLTDHDYDISPQEAEYPGAGSFVPESGISKIQLASIKAMENKLKPEDLKRANDT